MSKDNRYILVEIPDDAMTEMLFENRKSVQKFLFGTYSDGRARNLVDAIRNEVLSPKQKKELAKKKFKKNKK